MLLLQSSVECELSRLQTRMKPMDLCKTVPATATLPSFNVSFCAHLVQQNQGPLFGHNLSAVSSQRARCCRPAPQQQVLAMQHHYTSEGPSESPCKLQLQKPSRGCHLFAEMCCKKTRNNVAYTAIGQQQSTLTPHCHIKLCRQCKLAVRPGLALIIPSDRTDFSSLHCASSETSKLLPEGGKQLGRPMMSNAVAGGRSAKQLPPRTRRTLRSIQPERSFQTQTRGPQLRR